METLPNNTQGYILPAAKQLLWNNVNHCLMRREVSVNQSLLLTRVGILVEGPSGIGKSEMMLQALKKQGFSLYHEEAPHLLDNKIYFHITMGSDNISEIIVKAFHLGAVVVIDELNLLTQKDEALLTHLLEGRTPSKESAEKPGFCVLASQNSQLYAGRKPLSYALLSRLDRFYEEPYTKKDLIDIALQSEKFTNERQVFQFVEHFWQQQASHENHINVRNFFTEINKRPVTINRVVSISPDSVTLSQREEKLHYCPTAGLFGNKKGSDENIQTNSSLESIEESSADSWNLRGHT